MLETDIEKEGGGGELLEHTSWSIDVRSEMMLAMVVEGDLNG